MPTNRTRISPGFIPWEFVRFYYWMFRRMFFTRPEPRTPGWVVDAESDDVEDAFGRHYFSPNWEFSYNYRSEDINVARIVHKSRLTEPIRAAAPNVEWWQLHLRGWDRPDGKTRIRVHREPEPTEHPHQHINGVGAHHVHDNSPVDRLLDAEGLDYTYKDNLAPGENA